MDWVSGVVVRRIGLLVLVTLAVTSGLSACGESETAPKPDTGRTTSASSPSPRVGRTSAGPSCRRAQLKALRGLDLTEVVWLVTGDVDGSSAAASRQVLRGFERGEAGLEEPCGGLPEEMADVKRTVLVTTARPLTAAGLGRLGRVVDDWARELRARSPLENVTSWVQHCRDLATQLSAGYTVGWDYTERGRRWWVQMVIENDLPARVWIDIGGTLWATGLPRDPYSRNDGRGGQQVEWGGSSADSLYPQPSTSSTTQVGLPGPSGYLHTSAEGRVYGVRPEVFVRHGGPACSLPVTHLG